MYHSYDLKTLRDSVGIVLQKTYFFRDCAGKSSLGGGAEEEEIWEACRMACADEFLEKMPKGLDTDLGQGGVNVSGGQKQRLCIARTLLKKPKIIIFDDSTSAVDQATEGKIRKALTRIPGMTKIIIARLFRDQYGSDFYPGRWRDPCGGNARDFLKRDPIYQEIYASQMRGGGENGAQGQ